MNDRPAPIESSALIPEYWEITANSREDILFLGKVTIRQMVRSWRRRAGELSSKVKDVEAKITIFDGKTVADVLLLAKCYENPEFQEIGFKNGNWGDVEPLDDASIKRKSGKTTFNVCGWCKYASGGSCRHHYYITTGCGILRDAEISNGCERYFNTLCFLTDERWSDLFWESIIGGLANKKAELLEEKRLTDRKIRILLGLEKRADKKPALPDYRPCDWSSLGDPTVSYVGGWVERIVPDSFVTGTVMDGYRYHDGGVSICFDNRVHSGKYLDGRGGDYGSSRPEVMHAWEFEYLLMNHDFAKLWATSGTSNYVSDFDPNKFLLELCVKVSARLVCR